VERRSEYELKSGLFRYREYLWLGRGKLRRGPVLDEGPFLPVKIIVRLCGDIYGS